MSLGSIFSGVSGIGAGLSAVSGLASLFGRKPNYNSGPDLSAGRGYLTALRGVGAQYAGQASNALADYGADNGQYRGAVQNYANFLQTNPYTDTRSTADLARATTGSADAYQRARANLQASGAAAGVGGVGSSGLMGGMAGIEAGEAGSRAQAQNTQAYAQTQAQRENMQDLTSLYGGVSNQDYSRGMGALGAEQGVDGDLASQYLNLGQREQGMEMGQQAQQNQAFGGALGGLANLYGTQAGYAAGRPQPALNSSPSLPYGSSPMAPTYQSPGLLGMPSQMFNPNAGSY